MPSPSRVQIPSPNIYYRIQSVSLVSYLDLHDVDDYSVFLRPLHDDNEQKWIFVPSADGFKVMNAATERLRNKRYLSLDLQGRTDAYASTNRDSPRPTIWNVTREQEEEGIFSFICDSGNSNEEVFLSVNPHRGQTSFEVKPLSNTSILSRDMKWRILEVTPSIPKDIYRIRAWLGRALQMTSESDVVSLVPLKEKQHQEWEVEPLGNGRCTIKSVAAGSYLGWETDNNSITKVVKTNLPKEWIVKSISLNGYTYSITTSDKPLCGTKNLALTNRDASGLYMKPIKVTQNQVWFFEAVDHVSTDVSADGADPSLRYADITEKVWIIYNAQDSTSTQKRYITWLNFPDDYKPLCLYSDATTQNQFNLKYTTTGGEFHLTTSPSMANLPNIIRVGDEVKLGPQSLSGWVLQRVVAAFDTSGLYYFICAADDHNSVISAGLRKYTHSDGKTYDLLTMTTKKTENTPLAQLWRFGS